MPGCSCGVLNEVCADKFIFRDKLSVFFKPVNMRRIREELKICESNIRRLLQIIFIIFRRVPNLSTCGGHGSGEIVVVVVTSYRKLALGRKETYCKPASISYKVSIILLSCLLLIIRFDG